MIFVNHLEALSISRNAMLEYGAQLRFDNVLCI